MLDLTPTQRLEQLDEQSEALKAGLLDAAEALERSEHVPTEVTERLHEQEKRIAHLPDGLRSSDLDKDQLDTAWRALWTMRELLDRAGREVDLDTLDGLLVAVERFRHVIRDALDEYVPGLAEETAPVLIQLRRWLPEVPKPQLAELAGVTERTLTRWEHRSEPPNHRLAVVAKLVSVLRHSWSVQGVIAWFHRPRPELGGRRPIELLDRPEESRALLSAARATRSMYAT